MQTLCYLSLNQNPSSKQMAKERQKWTIEEEEALFAGVEKHGQGKWKVILTDPQFASTLANRSNIDLKDKWRNVSVNREKVRNPMSEGGVTNKTKANSTLDSPKPLSVVPLIEYGGTPAPSRSIIDRRIAPDYEAMILETLCYNEDPNGADTNAILSFIQQRYELPENFRRSVTSMLRRLVLRGELEKVDNNFKIYKGAYSGAEAPVPLQEDVGTSTNDKHDKEQEAIPSNDDDIHDEEQEAMPTNDDDKQDEEQETSDDSDSDSPLPTETIEDATSYAVNAVYNAENKLQVAIEAIEEADRFAKLVEESMAMQMLAEELHEKCLKEGRVLLAP